jgi:hypothetical protein
MTEKIIPVSRSLFVCDYALGYTDGRIDLGGIYNALHPAIYPHRRRSLSVFVQLTGGVGEVPFFVDIRQEEIGISVHTTPMRSMVFPNRIVLMQICLKVEEIRFPEPGIYVFDFFCHNTWVCDTTIHLH